MVIKDKINVLVFIDWFRPGYEAGGTVTSFGNFVDFLSPHIKFNIVTRNHDYINHTPYKNLSFNSWIKKGENQYYYISKLKLRINLIRKIIISFRDSIIYVNGIFSLYFSILPIIFSFKKKCIVNPHGMLSDQAFSVKSYKKRFFLFFANFFRIYKHVVFHVSNNDEANDVSKRIKCYKEIKIANQFPRKITATIQNKKNKNKVVRFVNVGRVSVEKGTLKMLKALEQFKSSLILDIYGPIYDKLYWNECKKTIKKLPKKIQINHKGAVPANSIPEILKNYDFFVLLSEGENFGHAILEGFTQGLPAIISKNTPWKNLSNKFLGWDVNAENKSCIIKAFNEALSLTDSEYNKYSVSCFRFAVEYSKSEKVLSENLSLFLNNSKSNINV